MHPECSNLEIIVTINARDVDRGPVAANADSVMMRIESKFHLEEQPDLA